MISRLKRPQEDSLMLNDDIVLESSCIVLLVRIHIHAIVSRLGNEAADSLWLGSAKSRRDMGPAKLAAIGLVEKHGTVRIIIIAYTPCHGSHLAADGVRDKRIEMCPSSLVAAMDIWEHHHSKRFRSHPNTVDHGNSVRS